MKTLRFLFVALLLCLLTPYQAFNQAPDKKTDKQSEKEYRIPEGEKNRPRSLQLFSGKDAKSMQGVDRAVLQLKFNQMVDEIDYLYHTPPQFQKHPPQYFGYQTKAKTHAKGEQ